MMDMQTYVGKRGTYASLATFGSARNSPFSSIIGANAAPNSPWAWAAALGMNCAFEAQQDPARPMQQVELKGLLAPRGFEMEERNLLLFDGISTWTVNAGGAVILDNVITTYQTNNYGIEDTSYLEIERMKTNAFLRYSMRARIAQRFPRAKLASNGTKGKGVITPDDIRVELIALAGDWEEKGLVEDLFRLQGQPDGRARRRRRRHRARLGAAEPRQPVPPLQGACRFPRVRGHHHAACQKSHLQEERRDHPHLSRRRLHPGRGGTHARRR